jgi:hypothetical protein
MFSTKNVNTTPISQKAILDRVSDYDLWVYYLGHCTLGKAFNSPLRKDKRPSAVLFVASNNKILMKDFATGEVFDVFKFLEAQGYEYMDTLLKIDSDFRLGFNTSSYKSVAQKPVISDIRPEYKKTFSHIMIKRKPWDKKGLDYWKQYHIDTETLNEFRVSSLSCFWVSKDKNIYLYESKDPMFCYEFGDQKYKIYRPYESNYRFVTNVDNDIMQGMDQLPWVGTLLIITKALKDVMVLHQLGFIAVAVQGETSFPSERIMARLKARFEKILVLFDNDAPGIEGSDKFCEKYKLSSITIPKDSNCKDVADYAKTYGLDKSKILIECLTETGQQDTTGKEK